MRYARICPNTNGWVSPSGGNKYSGPTTFPGGSGFGFDEWLLGTPTIQTGKFKGYKAGFIQGFRTRVPGFVTDVSCYWIDGALPREAHSALVILNCQKLCPADALAIRAEYTTAGFIGRMTTSLIGLNPPVHHVFPLNPLDMFNVVFQNCDAALAPPPNTETNRGYPYTRLFKP